MLAATIDTRFHKVEESMADKVIGFIGVGLMGHGMAKNIVEKGWPLVVMGHRNRAPVDDLGQPITSPLSKEAERSNNLAMLGE